MNRLSVSSGAGCGTNRILTSTNSVTSAGNNGFSSVISFPLQQNSQQRAIQTDPHSAATLSLTIPTLSSAQANTSLPTTILPNPAISESCYNTDGEQQLVKSPVTTALLYQHNALPNIHSGGEHPHHLQKQKPVASSVSCGFFQQTNYPAVVYLTDGESGHFGMV